MGDKRQKNQLVLAFMEEDRGEAPKGLPEGTESSTAKRGTESPAITEQLMEEVCGRENCKQALKRVKANKGSAGVDGMTVQQLPEYLKQHWPAIREQLLSGTYKPQPVRRVEIPKPDGGVRKLGIPTVLDRFVQQAVMQVLQGRWDRTFSEHSYGFRPGRSAHQAVDAAQQYMAEGYRWVVDLDLEKFLDRVPYCPLVIEKVDGCCIDHFDSQAFTPALPHQNSFQLAALYTLQHRLPRNAQFRGGYDHGHILRWRLLHDARPQFIVDANLPRRAWRDLLAGDETIGQPAMNADVFMPRICAALRIETSSPLGGVGWRLESRDTAIASQAADLVGGEAFARCGLASLTIEDSGDDFIGIKSGQARQQRERIFVGARPHRLESRDRDIQHRESRRRASAASGARGLRLA